MSRSVAPSAASKEKGALAERPNSTLYRQDSSVPSRRSLVILDITVALLPRAIRRVGHGDLAAVLSNLVTEREGARWGPAIPRVTETTGGAPDGRSYFR